MRISNKTGRPFFKTAIEAAARLDAVLNLLDEEDEAAFYDWAMNGGTDVSLVVRSLVIASLSDKITTTTTRKESTSDNV